MKDWGVGQLVSHLKNFGTPSLRVLCLNSLASWAGWSLKDATEHPFGKQRRTKWKNPQIWLVLLACCRKPGQPYDFPSLNEDPPCIWRESDGNDFKVLNCNIKEFQIYFVIMAWWQKQAARLSVTSVIKIKQLGVNPIQWQDYIPRGNRSPVHKPGTSNSIPGRLQRKKVSVVSFQSELNLGIGNKLCGLIKWLTT